MERSQGVPHGGLRSMAEKGSAYSYEGVTNVSHSHGAPEPRYLRGDPPRRPRAGSHLHGADFSAVEEQEQGGSGHSMGAGREGRQEVAAKLFLADFDTDAAAASSSKNGKSVSFLDDQPQTPQPGAFSIVSLGSGPAMPASTLPADKLLHQAVYAFEARNDDELTFPAGAVIQVLRPGKGGWWFGQIDTGQGMATRSGLFPVNRTKMLVNPLSNTELADPDRPCMHGTCDCTGFMAKAQEKVCRHCGHADIYHYSRQSGKGGAAGGGGGILPPPPLVEVEPSHPYTHSRLPPGHTVNFRVTVEQTGCDLQVVLRKLHGGVPAFFMRKGAIPTEDDYDAIGRSHTTHADSNTITAFVPYSEGVQGVWYIAISNIWEEPDADDVEHGQASGGGYKIDTRDYGMTFRLHVELSTVQGEKHWTKGKKALRKELSGVSADVGELQRQIQMERNHWLSELAKMRAILQPRDDIVAQAEREFRSFTPDAPSWNEARLEAEESVLQLTTNMAEQDSRAIE